LVGTRKSQLVLRRPSTVRVVVIRVVDSLTGIRCRTDSERTCGQDTHAHDFRDEHSTVDKSLCIVEDTSDNLTSVCVIVSFHKHEKLLTIFFTESHCLTE